MANRWRNTLTSDDVTPEAMFLNRRQMMAGAAALGLGLTASPLRAAGLEPNSFEDITSYNNYYEFGTGKDDPARYADQLTTDPWTIKIDGLVEKPGDYALSDLVPQMTIEERIYRFRCVEAWSMVVPWNGVELADVLNKVGVQSGGNYVAFETVVQPENMPGVRRNVIPFPYKEGLRMDEAMHPLTMLATGIYGEPPANQNGAPIRLVVPWKYGFKSIKSIVSINLVAEQPETTWKDINFREYGFFANVNPNVSHPRWSQATERVIGGGLFSARKDTLLYNGYDEVASLYEGMDPNALY